MCYIRQHGMKVELQRGFSFTLLLPLLQKKTEKVTTRSELLSDFVFGLFVQLFKNLYSEHKIAFTNQIHSTTGLHLYKYFNCIENATKLNIFLLNWCHQIHFTYIQILKEYNNQSMKYNLCKSTLYDTGNTQHKERRRHGVLLYSCSI